MNIKLARGEVHASTHTILSQKNISELTSRENSAYDPNNPDHIRQFAMMVAPINTGIPVDVAIAFKSAAQLDAFGRQRVSMPETIFDSKNLFADPDLDVNTENLPLFFDNKTTSGSGCATTYNTNRASQSISVASNTAGTRVRQSKMRFNYQPGKSQLVMKTFVLSSGKPGITQREGFFDEKNGLFLELNGTTCKLVCRSFTSGVVIDTAYEQSDWNIDKMDGSGVSGRTLDLTKAQILFIDFEWLGVGSIRMGFVIDGNIFYTHQFNHANIINKVYMSTPNLPVRGEISNDGTGDASSLELICCSVISEGGAQDLGITRYGSSNGAVVTCASIGSIYPIIGIRLKSAYIGATIKILNCMLQESAGSKRVEWQLIFNPTLVTDFTWTNNNNSAVQIGRPTSGAAPGTVSGGNAISGGYFESASNSGGNAGSDRVNIDSALKLGCNIDNVTMDTIVLCVRPVGGTNATILGSMTWRELL